MNKKSIVFRCLVALLCLVCTIVVTYSWFNRDGRVPNAGDRMLYQDEINVNNGAVLTMDTYAGTVNNGEVVYSETPIGDSDRTISNIEPGAKVHYKTNIKNTGDKAKVTLLLRNSNFSGFGNDIKFGVLEPVNTLKSYSSGSDIELVRNITVNKGEIVSIYWYVYLDSSSTATTGSMTLGNLYLFAN